MVDASEKSGRGDRYVFDMVKDVEKPVFLILNKIDLIKKVRLLPVIEEFSKAGSLCGDRPGVRWHRSEHRHGSRR